MKDVELDIGLDWPLQSASPVHSVLRHALGFNPEAPHTDAATYWDADLHGLTAVPQFQTATAEAQQRVLRRCNRALLEEAYFVERAGIAFATQMSLHAGNLEERMLYAAFAADEAKHLALLTPFVQPDATPSPFHHFLANLIRTADRTTLVIVVQVVLEGWGLTHYTQLASACRVPALAEAFQRIVRDEARHHGSGLLLAERDHADDATVDALTTLIGMVRAGPLHVVEAIELELSVPQSERETLLTQLDAPSHAAVRLRLIRQLLEKMRAGALLARLDTIDVFRVLPTEATA